MRQILNYVWPLSRPQEVQKDSHGLSSPSHSYAQFVAMAILFIHENKTGLPCSYCISKDNARLLSNWFQSCCHLLNAIYRPGRGLGEIPGRDTSVVLPIDKHTDSQTRYLVPGIGPETGILMRILPEPGKRHLQTCIPNPAVDPGLGTLV